MYISEILFLCKEDGSIEELEKNFSFSVKPSPTLFRKALYSFLTVKLSAFYRWLDLSIFLYCRLWSVFTYCKKVHVLDLPRSCMKEAPRSWKNFFTEFSYNMEEGTVEIDIKPILECMQVRSFY